MCRAQRWTDVARLLCTVALLALCALTFTSCRKRKAPVPTPAPVTPPAVEAGVASWYGRPYHGRRTANGEIYDMEKMTAAHRTRPFNTWVRVFSLDSGKTIEVRINDRGPFVDGRIIDLSRAAAREIEMLGPGTARVRVESMSPPQSLAQIQSSGHSSGPERFAVQVGAFLDLDNADRLRIEMESRYGAAQTIEKDADPSMWSVTVGDLADRAAAERLAERIKVEFGPAFVVRLDVPDELPQNMLTGTSFPQPADGPIRATK